MPRSYNNETKEHSLPKRNHNVHRTFKMKIYFKADWITKSYQIISKSIAAFNKNFTHTYGDWERINKYSYCKSLILKRIIKFALCTVNI